jgi:hypothetical protein
MYSLAPSLGTSGRSGYDQITRGDPLISRGLSLCVGLLIDVTTFLGRTRAAGPC